MLTPLLALLFSAPLTAQDTAAPRDLRAEDYGRFESLARGSKLSPDGRWLAYGVRRVNGESELRLKMLATDSHVTVEYGRGAAFSSDSRWVGYLIGVSKDEREKLSKAKKPVRTKLGLRDLTTGDSVEIDDVSSFSFSEDGRWIAMRRYAPKGSNAGADLVLRALGSSTDVRLGNVGSYAWCEEESLLALIVDGEDAVGNGVQLYAPETGVLRALDSANTAYGSLRWREDSSDLACFREMEHEDDEDVSNEVLVWRDLSDGVSAPEVYDHRKIEAFPDMRVVGNDGLRWSDDGARLFFGLKEWDERPEWAELPDEAEAADSEAPAEGAETAEGGAEPDGGDGAATEEPAKSLRETLDDPSNVEVWHVNDIDIIPRQKITERFDRLEAQLAAWSIDEGMLVILEDELTEDVRVLEGQRRALAFDNSPYEEQRRFGPTVNDVWVVDTLTGDREQLLESVKYTLSGSRDGRWFAYVQGDDVWVYDLDEGEARNLTSGVDAAFINAEMSQLTDQKPAYGVMGWDEDSGMVFLYDRWDVWAFPLDGSEPTRITEGRESSTRYRRVVLDFDEEEWIDLDRGMVLATYGDRTKRSGYARMDEDGVTELMVEDARVTGLVKAEDSDTFVWSQERYDDSPDLFVSGGDMEGRQVSETNAFLDEFHWGRSELVDFTSATGVDLQGSLTYPANYEAGKQYPMLVYIYELRSQDLHRFATPRETSAYSPAVFSAEGYFVFQPDIVYRAQNPGLSAKECIEPAVAKVLESGMVDPARVGLVGHSWGAYQTAFMLTHSDVFAAGVAGAPLTNMMSMSMSIYWNSGQTDTWIFHESQGRMDQPFWNDVDTYIANSPIFGIENLKNPLLVAFGDDDGAVDFNQGVEMYNAARLAQVPFVMLVYPGENHGLRQEPNQVDYHYRILEWFGAHLKGDEAPSWITEGQSWIDRQDEIEAD
ncbi:MAG: prolyl oligopeptidase family serine peptidase [Planctomycetota bacterium]